jgi:vancomycin resistance protein VanW
MMNRILELRRQAAQARRSIRDAVSGVGRRMIRPCASRNGDAGLFVPQVTVEQPFLPTDTLAAKLHNIDLARERMENLPIPPKGVFSFWRLVGKPTLKNGFQAGRSLLGGQLRADYGGGLCQLSGLIYLSSLVAGLRSLERHPHSRDIYDDATRYAPLGADAAVAYGFKDLRIENCLNTAICYRLLLSDSRIACSICGPEPIVSCQVEFEVILREDSASLVETRRRGPGETKFTVVAVSRYPRLASGPSGGPS